MNIHHTDDGTTITIDERLPYGEPDTVATITIPYQPEALNRLQLLPENTDLSNGCDVEIPSIGVAKIFFDDDSRNLCLGAYRGGTQWVTAARLKLNDGRVLELEVSRR